MQDAITLFTVQFVLVLALAFVVERVIELLKSVYDLCDSHWDWCNGWDRMTERIKDSLEREMRVFEYVSPEVMGRVLHKVSDLLLNERGGYTGTIPMLSGDLVRCLTVKIVAKLVACLLGILIAYLAHIDLLKMWVDAGGAAFIGTALGIPLSGITIGLGSGPVHKLITTIEQRQRKTEAEVRSAG